MTASLLLTPLMKTHRAMFASMLMALSVTAHAQDTAAPAAASAQTEMQKWIAATDAPWQATFKRDVADVHAAELKKLAQQYATSLEAAINSEKDDAADARRREATPWTAVAPSSRGWKRQRHSRQGAARQIRSGARTGADSAHAAQRLDDALLVKNKREEVAARG